MKSSGWFVNQCLALSPNENGNNHCLSASSVTPIVLDCVAYFNEVCQMRVRIFTWQTVELNVLKHLQCYCFQLKIVLLNRWSSDSRLNNRRR